MAAAVKQEVAVCRDPEEMARQAAERFALLAAEAAALRGRFRVALAGGRTPRRLYECLAGDPHRSAVPWERVEVFWGDERWVPPDHPDSNFRLAHEALLAHVPVPAAGIHPMRAGGTPDEAAAVYERELRNAFGLSPAGGVPPRFDLILLGLGPDGHTASLFPGSPALDAVDHLVAAPFVPALAAYRLTLTLPVLNAAAHVVFLVAGADKAAVLRAALGGTERLPASRVRPRDGALTWLVDRAAWGGEG